VILHLVRHGKPVIDQARPADTWPLAPEAPADVLRLRDAGVLPTRGRWFSSREPKALDTARLLTAEHVEVVDDLGEQRRTARWFDDAVEFRAVVHRAHARPDAEVVPGWEPLTRTRRRVTAAADTICFEANGVDVVMAGHGTAWTLLVAELTDAEPDLHAWAAMTMPDHCAVEVAARRITSPWGIWRNSAQPTSL